MSEIVFTPFTMADMEPLAKLWQASVAEMGLAMPTPDLAFFEGKLAELAPIREITLARQGARLCGFIALDPEAAVLDQLFLDPSVLRRGLGARLFALAVARMPEGFTLYTPSSNTRARAFYIAQGMVEIRQDKHPVWGHPITYLEWRPPSRQSSTIS